MVRIEIQRRLDCKQGKGRNRVNPTIVTHEATEPEAIQHVIDYQRAADEIAPGYMPILAVRFFDNDAYAAWVKNGGAEPVPFRVFTGDEIADLEV